MSLVVVGAFAIGFGLGLLAVGVLLFSAARVADQ